MKLRVLKRLFLMLTIFGLGFGVGFPQANAVYFVQLNPIYQDNELDSDQIKSIREWSSVGQFGYEDPEFWLDNSQEGEGKGEKEPEAPQGGGEWGMEPPEAMSPEIRMQIMRNLHE